MGKIIKTMQSKHKRDFVSLAEKLRRNSLHHRFAILAETPVEIPSRWPFGRGDLYHWIPLLNRFDSILEHFNKT
ncbi:E3 ubiquitin-protein ligase tom1 [Metarhizium acridum]|nr:E3 ubiquitin-protein ligase tom1 [Metarhizium acridum]